jgi:hypothetical protein
MVEIAGFATAMDWVGTFAQIILPGVLVGGLLGYAEYLRRTGGRRGWRWLAAAPVLMAVAPLLSPEALVALVTTGIGGGAIAVPLFGALGGFALSGRGPVLARAICGLVAASGAIAGAIAGAFISPDRLSLTEPRGVWVALLFLSLKVLLALACSIPHRPVLGVQPSRANGAAVASS